MAKLSSEKRNQLKDSDFGIPEKRMYPLHDKAHIESAVKLFGHAETKYKKSLARKILRRAKEYNMDTSGWKQVLSFAQEAVPPMSNGTSLGNIPPGLTAPYEYSERDELMSRVNSLGNTDMFTFAKSIVNEIHAQVEKDRKPPTGNQNCQLCTWCAEARFRGMNVLPRPVYSPRDPALAVPGENIVMNPVKEKIATQRQVIETVRGAVNSRWYVHINWKDSEGGHEFLVVNINDYAYIMDAQAGLLKEIDETDSTNSYFRDINYANSYMVRLDTKKFNTELFNEMNDPSKVLPWNPELDVPYMKEHGMLGDMSDKWTMRPATEADLEFVYFSELETVGENKNDPKVQKYIREDAKESLGHTQIIVADDSDIGVYQAYATDYYGLREGKKDWWYLAHIYIKPEYRTLGIGSAIIKRDIAEHDKILLQVMKSNTRAKKLYESLGFVVDMENDHGGLVMRLDKTKPIQEQMLDGIGAATGDEEHKIPVKCPDNMSRDEKIFYRALFGEFDSSMQMDNMIEKIIWPFAQKEGLAQNAYNKLYEYCHHKKKDDATLDDIEDSFEHFDYVWGFLFPPASGEVVSATKAYIMFDSDCTYLDKSDQTRPKGYVQFKLEITLKNNKDFFAQMVSPKTGNVMHYMTLHMKEFGDYMDERDIKKQMEQLSKEKVIEAMPEDMRRFIESIKDPKFYHYPMEETGIKKVGDGLWIFDKDTIASDFLIAFKYLPEVKKLSEWGDWNKKLEILEKTPVKKLTVAVSDDIGDLYIVYDLSSGKLKETWNGKVIANSWKEFESKLKQESFTQEGAFQESTNVFESGHFSKYKDDVLGFNDEGMAVMKKCDCGGKISIAMKGEPVYICESCGKYYGTVPCNIQEGAVRNIRDMTLVPVKDFKYNKVYYGDPTNGGDVRVLNGKPLFVTPQARLASIFIGRREVFHELSRRGYHDTNLGYDEWNTEGSPDEYLTDVHVYVKYQPDLEPFVCEFDGYLHTIDCSNLKNNIYRYPWMSGIDYEVLIAKVPEIKIENVKQLHVRYHVRGIVGKIPTADETFQEGADETTEPNISDTFDEQLLVKSKPILQKYLDGGTDWKYYNEHRRANPLPADIRDALFSLVHVLIHTTDDFAKYDKYRKFLCDILGLPNDRIIYGPGLMTIEDGDLQVRTLAPETETFSNSGPVKLYHTSNNPSLTELRPTYMSAKNKKLRAGFTVWRVEALYPTPRVYFGYNAPISRMGGSNINDQTYVYLASDNDISGKTIKADTELKSLDGDQNGAACFVETVDPIRVTDVTAQFRKSENNNNSGNGSVTITVDQRTGKVVQEGAFQDLKNGVNPYSDDLVFHVSPDKHIDGQIWKPRVPDYLDPYNPEDTGFEDNTTPRICFSTSIEGALNGITVNLQRQSPDTFDKMYVYVPEKPWKQYKHRTNKELVKDKLVYDANVTREVWIMEPVRMKLYGVIRVDQIADAKRKSVVPTSKGQKDTRNYFTYKWHWVVKPKVLKKATKFDYSPERVIDDLCIDIKKFKYGLIKDGRLMTGNVSDKDYDKYWVFHSGEEVDQAGGGNCYDMVEYEAGYLDAFGVAYKKYFMNFTDTKNTKTINTHTICVVPHNGKFIYIEQAFKRVVDEWGYERKKVFDKLNDIFEYVAEVSAEYDNQDLNYGVWDYTNAEIDYGTPIKNFMEWIMTKCKMVYDGEASKPKSIKEGFKLSRFNSTRFYQEEEEYLSEDITVGDIDLDDEKDNPEDIQTDETSATRNTPEKVETSEEKETTEEPEEIEPIENFEDIDIGSDEVPEYMKDRLSEEDKKEFESDDNNEMDVNNVELGSFGSDTSDVQNDYDQKEVDILMKLMASEADAMNEYMDGAKETNVDVLRRLYADIANEERFHMEQLLFAKSELTGEKYIPRDPDVKSEYEELLKMGMDENTAMQTAVDKCHIRGISVSVDDDVDEMKETQEEVETLEYAVEMFAENFDSFMKEFEMSDREKSFDKFVQEYLAMEAVTPEGKEVHKGLELGRNPITVLMKAADFVIKLLVELCRKIKVFLDRVKRSSANFKNYVQQIKMDPNGWKTFFEPIMLYFMPHYDSLNGKRVAIMPREMYQWYMLAYDTVVECGKCMNINVGIQPDAIAQQYRAQNINGDIKKGAEMLNSIHLSREPMVKPADDDARNELIDMFMGYSDIIGEDGKSYNMLGSYQKFADIWRELLKQTEAMMKALVSAQNQVNENPQLRNTYELCMTGLNAVIKSSKAFAAAITKDINTIIKLDSDVYEAVRNKDNKRIEENEVAKNQNQAYKDRFGKVRNMNDANPPK